MAARTRISGKCQCLFSGAPVVQVRKMIQHPKRIKSRHITDTPLLPVNPPKIHPLFFQRMQHCVKPRMHPCSVRYSAGNRNLFFRILFQSFCHASVAVLKRAYAVSRVQIQGNVQSPVMQPRQKFLWLWKKFTVPCIPCPAGTILWVNLCQVPIHIHNSNRKRHLLFFKLLHQFLIGFRCVTVVTAPPVSKREPRQQRHTAG